MTRRLIVVGTVRFSRACLDGLLRHGANLVGVITGDHRALARHSDACSLRDTADRAGVPCLDTHDVNGEAVRHWIEQHRPDVLLVVGWSQMIGPPVMAIPSLAAIGSHPTLLPEGRGRHPIVWTLVDGKRKSGLTYFVLHERADAGDIVLQEAFDITDDDDAATVYARIEALGASMMPALLGEIEAGLPNRIPQDPARATAYRKRSARDGEIDWRQPAAIVRNLVRALTHPYPGAHTFVRRPGGLCEIKVWRATFADIQDEGGVPGDVVERGESVFGRAGDNWLRLDLYTPEGSLRSGDRLESVS